MAQDQLPPHTLRAFDMDILRIRDLIRQCGTLASRQVGDAVDAMLRRDTAAAGAIAAIDEQIDALQGVVELDALNTISRRSPQADDLRELFSAIKIAGDLERVGDYAKNIAKRTVALAATTVVDPESALPRIAAMVTGMIDDAVKAYIERDANLARDVVERDVQVDQAYNDLFRATVLTISESADHIAQGAHLLFVGKNLERVGDHATNIAEITWFSVTGQTMAARSTEASAFDKVSGGS
ncbi:MAG: phosphate signaling complex protein PhoU [Sphingomonadales bacterium]|nr:phosphate signaling complex protein PhoU [Sphingomonadales bacterium]MDE2170010.1 phosphate signaling complex protein PhoU [Sphingomonadales bacterium]